MSKAQFLAERQRPGEIYAGLMLGKNGQPDYHLFLLPQKPTTPKNDWDSSMSWAASVGGVLPTPSEQSLLHANRKEHFEKDWYWSSEQDAHSTVTPGCRASTTAARPAAASRTSIALAPSAEN